MTIESYIGLETSFSLLHSYDFVAREHKRLRRLAAGDAAEAGSRPPLVPMTFEHYGPVFTLLSINAAIVEGTMRSILTEQILSDRRSAIDQANAEGRTGPTRLERLLEQFHLNVEMNGGWESLKNQYSDYLSAKFSTLVSSTTADAIESLFTLRNVLAHGTALVVPKDQMEVESKDAYPYKWQTKLQRANVLLEARFGRGDIFSNLADDGVPEFFFDETKTLFSVLEARFDPLPSRVRQTVEKVKDFSFGYRNFG